MPRSRRQQGEGSVFRRSRDGRWVARADLGPGRGRREFVASTPGEAIGRRQEFLDRRRDGFTMPKGRQPYVSEWLLYWLHNIARPKVAPSTWASYRHKVDLIVPYFDRLPLPDLDEEVIEQWHARLHGKVSRRTGEPLSATTIASAHRVMSLALKVAVVRKRISRNPCSNVTPPRAEEEARPLPPSADEVMAILRECEDRRSGPRWVTAIATGMRQGEALGLLWPYVDLAVTEEASVAVEWALTRVPWEHGCDDPRACGAHVRPCPRPCPRIRVSGRPHACIPAGDPRCCPPSCEEHARTCPARRGGVRLKRPKSAQSRRAIPLPPYAAAVLRQWRTDQKAERLAHPEWRGWAHDPASCRRRLREGQHVCPACMLPAEPGMLVFARPEGTPLDPRADWQDWSDLLEDAGLPHYRTHDNRHGYATMLLEGGEDIRVVQELMGHATPDFTRRAYQHVRRHLRQRAAGTIERALRGQ